MVKVVAVQGRTVADFARHVGVDASTVKEWIQQDRLNVIEYRHQGGELRLVLDEAKPPRLVPNRRKA